MFFSLGLDSKDRVYVWGRFVYTLIETVLVNVTVGALHMVPNGSRNSYIYKQELL